MQSSRLERSFASRNEFFMVEIVEGLHTQIMRELVQHFSNNQINGTGLV